jgi:hypothetical protein
MADARILESTQSGLPELGWKTLADIWRADPPRPVVANTSFGTAGPKPREER